MFFVFAAAAAGVLLSFYIDLVFGLALFLGVSLIALLLKRKKTAIVLFVLALSFLRASYYVPTKAELSALKQFNLPASTVETRKEYNFLDKEIESIRAIPVKVIGEKGELVAAVAFGEKSGLDKNTKEVFKKAGISHILAVSGLHAGIVMAALCFALKKVKRKVRLPILYGFLAVMVVLSGFTPSVLRAALMMGIFLIADTFGFRYNLLNSLFLAGAIIVLALPYNLFNIGFILSFTATLGIGLFYPYLYCKLKNWGEYFGGSISIYVACQAALLPVSLMLFNTLSIYGVLGNLFAVPIVSFALISAMIGLLLYPLGLSYYPFMLSATLMEIIEYIAGQISALPFSSISTGAVYLPLAAVYLALIASLCVFTFKKRKYTHGALWAGAAAMIALCVFGG